MKNLRSSFERFCYRNRNKGIPNLMLYLCLGSGIVYLLSRFANSLLLYQILCFDRASILQGQVWRLFTYPLTYGLFDNRIVLVLISLLCYYTLGRAIENRWGTFRFNLYYLCGIVMMDIYCMIFGGMANVDYLNLSLLLGFATLYPNMQFFILFVIPIKAWVLALFNLVLVLIGLVLDPFPLNILPVISIANYFLFFGKDVVNVIPLSWRVRMGRMFRKKKKTVVEGKVIPFPTAVSHEATVSKTKAPYTHRCTICGRTDVSNPELEFRYCSRCNGYYCYCEEHISNHAHIE